MIHSPKPNDCSSSSDDSRSSMVRELERDAMIPTRLEYRANALGDRDGALCERRGKAQSPSSRKKGPNLKNGAYWKIANDTLAACNIILRLISIILRLVLWPLSFILSSLFTFHSCIWYFPLRPIFLRLAAFSNSESFIGNVLFPVSCQWT